MAEPHTGTVTSHPRHTVTGPVPASGPAHALRPHSPGLRGLAAVGAGAILLAVGLGVAVHLGSDDPAPSAPPSAQRMTVTTSGQTGVSPRHR